MLKYSTDDTDTDKVKSWLSMALEAGKASGKTAQGLAEHCGTTRQAITGWKKTGRITKTNLAKAAEYFGHGPSFTSSGLTAREPDPKVWPFPGIDPARFDHLTHDERIEIQGLVRDRIERFEETKLATLRKRA